MRLQVFLSRNGVCSRRRALPLVLNGHVSVNGQIVREPSTPVDPQKDRICVNGTEVKEKAYAYILLNKPRGYVTTRKDRFAKETVIDLLPKKYQHLSPVGRLDRDTQGLLLLTNDGEAAFKLTHPSFDIDKAYFVRVLGKLETKNKMRIEKGVMIENKKTASAKIKNIKILKDQTEFTITIHEGRKRQVRLMLAKVGHKVVYLKRISQGPISLGSLSTGGWRELNWKEIKKIKGI